MSSATDARSTSAPPGRPGGVLDGMGAARRAATRLLGAPAARWTDPLTRLVHGADQLATIAAIHATAGLQGGEADAALVALLDDERTFVVEHAAWALSARSPQRTAVIPLAGIISAGGFAGMLAQRTLEGWAETDGAAVATAVRHVLHATDGDERSARLVETLGLTRSPDAVESLVRVAGDAGEGAATRIAAVGGLGDLGHGHDVLVALTAADDELGAHAALALHDHWQRSRPVPAPSDGAGGIAVGQVFVHAAFGDSARAGAGEHGGIATLLTLLDAELALQRRVRRVVTIGRGDTVDALLTGWPVAGRTVAAIPFGASAGVAMADAWAHRVAIERGIARVLRAVGGLDLLHLRMADVGSLAAARVARRAGLPIVFTAAPDPHATIAALEDEGSLTRADFGTRDASEHWWFRVRMVERLTAQADHVVLLPRPGGPAELARLLDADLRPGSTTTVSEGVDATTVRRARRRVRTDRLDALGPAVDDLLAALSRLPRRRRRLPIVISVGRLHPVKGMERVAAAWRSSLATTTNLVIVGGDLAHPSADERRVLDQLHAIGAEQPGLVLLGQRGHAEVATLLHVAAGLSDPPFPPGIYVAGSPKEEFGLAIAEAMAAGLAVVAPAAGGPSTYVRDGVDGILVHERTTDALATAMERALALRAVPGRAAATTARVLADLTIERMAARLADVYAEVAADRAAAP